MHLNIHCIMYIYRISAALCLSLITITSISCAESSSPFLYFKFCSFTLMMLSISWFWAATGMYEDIVYHGVVLCRYISQGMYGLLHLWLTVFSLSNKVSNYYWLKKIGLVKKITIRAKFTQIFDNSSKKYLSQYCYIGPSKQDTTKIMYWKLYH